MMSSGRGEEGVLFYRGCVRAWCIFGWMFGGAIRTEGGVERVEHQVSWGVAGVAGCSSPAVSGWQGCGSLGGTGGRVREV